MAVPRICSIPDCDKKHFGLGYCRKHYNRVRRNGDPLKVEGTQPGDVQDYYRDVVLAFDGEGCLIWPFSTTGGYGHMHRNGKTRIVSRLLCEDVYGPPPSEAHQAAHSCGMGHLGCVSKGHLSWKTPGENSADKIVHGTSNRGERHGASKLTESKVREILALKGRDTTTAIADAFGVSRGAVSSIYYAGNWAWIDA